MLYIRIELWPRGDRSKAKVLGEATIANVGGSEQRGSYKARLSKANGFRCRAMRPNTSRDLEVARVTGPLEGSVWKETAVRDFPRKRLGPWDLLYRVLQAAIGFRNEGENHEYQSPGHQ